MDLQELKERIVQFSKERNWEKHHTPKELAIKLVLESSEMLELFEWLKREEVDEILKDESFRAALEDEFADVMRTLLQLSHVCDIDMIGALERKHKESKERFPVDRSKDLDMLEWKLKKIKKHRKVGL